MSVRMHSGMGRAFSPQNQCYTRIPGLSPRAVMKRAGGASERPGACIISVWGASPEPHTQVAVARDGAEGLKPGRDELLLVPLIRGRRGCGAAWTASWASVARANSQGPVCGRMRRDLPRAAGPGRAPRHPALRRRPAQNGTSSSLSLPDHRACGPGSTRLRLVYKAQRASPGWRMRLIVSAESASHHPAGCEGKESFLCFGKSNTAQNRR